MSRLLSKRIKRVSRTRCLLLGLERLEVRNLLAADLVPDEVAIAAKEETDVEERSYELTANFAELEEATWMPDGTDGGEPKVYELSSDEEPLEPGEEELQMTFWTLAMTSDPIEGEEFIEVQADDGESLPDQPLLYFRSLSGGVVDHGAVDESAVDDGAVDDGAVDDETLEAEVSDGEVVEGEVFDDSVFYTLSFGDGGDVDGELFLEMVPGDETVELDEVSDEVSDEGEIRYFGSVTSENSEVLAAESGPFMSPWYNRDNPLDANLDGAITALDALIVFNSLNHLGSVQLSHSLFALASATTPSDLDESFLVDASNDGFLSPLDALLRLNYLNRPAVTDDPADSAGGPGPFASILPGEWDQYESSDRIMLEEPLLLEDAGYDDSTEVFGARLADPALDWSEGDWSDTEEGDEFWSMLADDAFDASLDEELLDILARV